MSKNCWKCFYSRYSNQGWRCYSESSNPFYGKDISKEDTNNCSYFEAKDPLINYKDDWFGKYILADMTRTSISKNGPVSTIFKVLSLNMSHNYHNVPLDITEGEIESPHAIPVADVVKEINNNYCFFRVPLKDVYQVRDNNFVLDYEATKLVDACKEGKFYKRQTLTTEEKIIEIRDILAKQYRNLDKVWYNRKTNYVKVPNQLIVTTTSKKKQNLDDARFKIDDINLELSWDLSKDDPLVDIYKSPCLKYHGWLKYIKNIVDTAELNYINDLVDTIFCKLTRNSYTFIWKDYYADLM